MFCVDLFFSEAGMFIYLVNFMFSIVMRNNVQVNDLFLFYSSVCACIHNGSRA